jgi:ABC-2 type transport system permease protein
VALVFLLFLLGMFEGLLTSEGLKQALSYVNLFDHIDEFSRGIVDTRRLAYYGTGVLFFLFLATRALEDKKWR